MKFCTKASPKKVRSVLDYDPNTGIFTWKKSTRGGWVGKKAGHLQYSNKNEKVYLKIKIDEFNYSAHRLAWVHFYGKWPKMLDHINGNSLDNRICNLRECNNFQNTQNHTREFNKNGMPIGVRKTKNGRFSARISVNKKQIHLGVFDNVESAVSAYKKHRKENHDCPAFLMRNI